MSKENFDDKIKEVVELALLYDFYGELLKQNTREMFEDYIFNDYSLGEIADKINISRQGVYDIIKRSGTQLKNYEKKLHLVEKYKNQKKDLTELETGLKDIRMKETDDDLCKRIDRILSKIEDMKAV